MHVKFGLEIARTVFPTPTRHRVTNRVPASQSPPARTYRLDIEGLRAIAVGLVVAFHFDVGGFHGGFIGVDLFFVISGYLITGLLTKEKASTGSIDLLRFYGRRARRLLPAALLSTVVTLIVGGVIFAPPEMLAASKAAFASSIYLSNVWFLRATLDYFSPESALNPFLHTWSLSVEEQFYLVWPTLVLWLGARPGHRDRWLWVMVATLVASLVACIVLTAVRQPWAFYLSPTRAWEFAIGALASAKVVENAVIRRVPPRAVWWLGAGAVTVALFLIDQQTPFPGWAAVCPALGAAAVLLAGSALGQGRPSRLLANPLMVWIGKRSYSIYLWHWPVIVFARVLFPTPSSMLTFAMPVGATLITLVGAAASYRWVESPIRHNGWLAHGRHRAAAFAGCMTAIGAIVALGAVGFFGHFSKVPAQAAIASAMNTYPVASGSKQNCLVAFASSDVVTCTFGRIDAPTKTVVLFGDSHADHWSSLLAALAEQKGWRLVTVLKAFCPAAGFSVYVAQLNRMSGECDAWRTAALARILALKPDLVLIAQASGGYVSGPLTSLGPHAASHDAWSRSIASTVAPLDAAGLHVLLIRDTPFSLRSSPVCLARIAWRHGNPERCAMPRAEVLDERTAQAERAALAPYRNATYADLTDRFCSTTTCPATIDDIVVYRDNNHVSNAYAIHLLPLVERTIDDAMRPPS